MGDRDTNIQGWCSVFDGKGIGAGIPLGDGDPKCFRAVDEVSR